MASEILLRDVIEDDLNIFFEQERDPEANLMAAYPCKEKPAFLAHWKKRSLDTSASFIQTILFNQAVAGSIECWKANGQWLVGYWIGREFWRQGIATAALQKFLIQVKQRPLHAHVATHNAASIKVLEKCSFKVTGRGTIYSEVHGREIEEIYFIVD